METIIAERSKREPKDRGPRVARSQTCHLDIMGSFQEARVQRPYKH